MVNYIFAKKCPKMRKMCFSVRPQVTVDNQLVGSPLGQEVSPSLQSSKSNSCHFFNVGGDQVFYPGLPDGNHSLAGLAKATKLNIFLFIKSNPVQSVVNMEHINKYLNRFV